MSCEHLVCARCAGPVVEGRCSVCRAARAEVHTHDPFGIPPHVAAVLVVLLALITVLAVHLNS